MVKGSTTPGIDLQRPNALYTTEPPHHTTRMWVRPTPTSATHARTVSSGLQSLSVLFGPDSLRPKALGARTFCPDRDEGLIGTFRGPVLPGTSLTCPQAPDPWGIRVF
jgi:hypothetical protein